MNNPLVFCAYAPGHREEERRVAWESIRALTKIYPTVLLPCYGDQDYSHGLIHVWGHPGDLISIEHDVYTDPRMVQELADCRHPRCTWITWASQIATGLRRVVLAYRMRGPNYPHPAQDGWGQAHGGSGDDLGYSDTTSICLIKLDQATRKESKLTPDTWADGMCSQINNIAIPRGGWHLHGPPTPHYHGFRRDQNDHIRGELEGYLDRRYGQSITSGRRGHFGAAKEYAEPDYELFTIR